MYHRIMKCLHDTPVFRSSVVAAIFCCPSRRGAVPVRPSEVRRERPKSRSSHGSHRSGLKATAIYVWMLCATCFVTGPGCCLSGTTTIHHDTNDIRMFNNQELYEVVMQIMAWPRSRFLMIMSVNFCENHDIFAGIEQIPRLPCLKVVVTSSHSKIIQF